MSIPYKTDGFIMPNRKGIEMILEIKVCSASAFGVVYKSGGIVRSVRKDSGYSLSLSKLALAL